MGDPSFNRSSQEITGSSTELFEDFKDHLSGKRIATELVFLEVVRKAHPRCAVTRISPTHLDFRGYASAGHATITSDCDDNVTVSTRRYVPRGSRMETVPGKLSNDYEFVRWHYVWKEYRFTLYEFSYPLDWKAPTKIWFVVSEHEQESDFESTVEGHSVTDELLLAVGAWSADLHDEIYVFDDSQWHKSKELWTSVKGSSWDDVILEPVMKGILMNDVQGFFDNRKLYRSLAVPWKRGLILHGVPGNGKTLSIKALINSLNDRQDPVPSLYVKSFDNQCQGEKVSIQSIFSRARNMAPCLLIFEDLDSLVTDENRSYFLNEVDGLESNDGILMIGSTNHLETLDPAISKRPSRFDRKYNFKIPSENEREAYCRFWQGKLESSELVNFEEELCTVIAKLTEGFSFAYLKELFVVALLAIARGSIGNEQDDNDEEVNDRPVAETKIQPSTDDTTSDDGSSVDGTVIVEQVDMKNDSTEEVKATTIEVKDEIKVVQKPKRTIPQVEIPDSVKDNVLLKVVTGQVKTLLEEMDNTKEEDWATSKKQAGGVPGSARNINVRRMVRAR